ncbi:MAG: hypothetical protein MRY21_00215 [Simkaniaceae bacterium]|nr:hypothetical protein [Simkaniaceae bacterium]
MQPTQTFRVICTGTDDGMTIEQITESRASASTPMMRISAETLRGFSTTPAEMMADIDEATAKVASLVKGTMTRQKLSAAGTTKRVTNIMYKVTKEVPEDAAEAELLKILSLDTAIFPDT